MLISFPDWWILWNKHAFKFHGMKFYVCIYQWKSCNCRFKMNIKRNEQYKYYKIYSDKKKLIMKNSLKKMGRWQSTKCKRIYCIVHYNMIKVSFFTWNGWISTAVNVNLCWKIYIKKKTEKNNVLWLQIFQIWLVC